MKSAVKNRLTVFFASVLCLAITIQFFPQVKTAVMDFAVFSAFTAFPIFSVSEDSSVPENVASSEAESDFSVPAESSGTLPEGVAGGVITTKQLSVSTANATTDHVHVSNRTGVALDLDTLLAASLPFTITDGTDPQVLIVHTHATECYLAADNGYYTENDATRSTDCSKNVVRVGDEIQAQLEAAGIVTLHDSTLHDYPEYTGGYSRAADTIRSYLQKYPSIKVVIDGHRDSISGSSESEKVKPTAVINGKNAAQVMLVAGCQTGDITDFPNWQENLKVILKLQKKLETDYSGLSRSVLFTAARYNMNLTTGSMLIEIGSEANTLDEAIYSGQLVGKALAAVLRGNAG